jgi:ferredoxin, 2Fe-2S
LARVTFVRPGGEETEVDAPLGENVMRVALDNGIYEISGECGGVLACATCHVYVDQAFAAQLPPPVEDEIEMLEFAETERRDTSRLSCQIIMTPELDGLKVTVANPG